MRLFLTIMAMFVCGYSDLASAQQLPECQDGKAVSFKGTIQSVSPLSGIPPLPTMWTIVIAQTGGDCAVSEIVLEVQPNAECVVGATIEGKGDTGEDVVPIRMFPASRRFFHWPAHELVPQVGAAERSISPQQLVSTVEKLLR